MKFDKDRLENILKRNENKKVVLPNFQRDFVWDHKKQKKLLAFFMLGLPIGNILMLYGKKDDFAARDLCTRESIDPKEECIYLLDGQQRISTFKAIFSDPYDIQNPGDWRDVWNKHFNNLRKRWFIKINGVSSEVDLFNYQNLNFDKNKINKVEPSSIEDIFYSENILVKDEKIKWFHPSFIPCDRDGNPLSIRLKRNKIAQAASALNLVPLFELYPIQHINGQTLHKLCLDRIAEERIAVLKQEAGDDNEEIIKILLNAQPAIEEILFSEDYEQELEYAWTNLKFQWVNDVCQFLETLLQQEIAQILLPEGEINRAFAIFEEINRGGTPLDEYDLIVAKAARQKGLDSLSDRIRNLIIGHDVALTDVLTNKIHGKKPDKFRVEYFDIIQDKELKPYFKNHYLNLLSIYSHTEYGKFNENKGLQIKTEHIKRGKILELTPEQINDNTEKVIESLNRAYTFLTIRCGITNLNGMPYRLMILPIAYAVLDNNIWNDKNKIDKIEYWYWASIFGGSYQYDQNNIAIKDISALYFWLKNGGTQFKNRYDEILSAAKYSSKEVLLLEDEDNPPQTTISKAILQYILSNQPNDFLDKEHFLTAWNVSNEKEFEYNGKKRIVKLEDHHICPLGAAVSIGQSSKKIRADKKHILNSPLNRTYISSVANSAIRDKLADKYLEYIDQPAQWRHCIPTPVHKRFKQQDNEADKQYYKRILSERYYELQKEIKNELSKLVS